MARAQNRGYEAYGTDEDQLAGFYNNETGERVANPADIGRKATLAWRAHYTWKLRRSVVENLKINSFGKTVFLCGVASNEEEYLDLFDKLFALVVDTETLHDRITSRTNNTFGKNEGELEQIKEWQAGAWAYYAKYGYVKIDANKPVKQVTDEILARL